MEKENKNIQENKQTNISKKSRSGLVFIILLLVALIAVVTYLYIDQRQTTDEIKTVLTAEKDSLRSNLERLRMEYDSLETDNDTLNAQLNSEKQKIDDLLVELKQVKVTNYAKIKELQDELGTLRKVAKSYVRQIDSLNTINKELVAENIKVKNEIRKALNENEELEETNKDLSDKVEMASILRTQDIKATPINKRGKEKNTVNKVEKIKVCFTIKENVLVEPGERIVYLRIAGPDDFILAKSVDDLFEFEGQQIVYSAKRPIDYMNADVDVCIYWENNGELIPGSYDVYLFTDGYQIGTTSFIIEDSGWF